MGGMGGKRGLWSKRGGIACLCKISGGCLCVDRFFIPHGIILGRGLFVFVCLEFF